MKLFHAGVLFLSSMAFVTGCPTSVWAAEAEGDADATAAAADAEAAPAPAEAAPAPKAVEEAAPKTSTRAVNSIFGELLGAALLYSINYERLLIEDLGLRVGLSYWSFSASAGTASSSVTFLTFPIEVSYLGVGSAHHMLELGGGATMWYASGTAESLGRTSSGSGFAMLPSVRLGYRLHPVDGGGFQFRVGLQTFMGKGVGLNVDDPSAFGFLPWPYISFGGSFGS